MVKANIILKVLIPIVSTLVIICYILSTVYVNNWCTTFLIFHICEGVALVGFIIGWSMKVHKAIVNGELDDGEFSVDFNNGFKEETEDEKVPCSIKCKKFGFWLLVLLTVAVVFMIIIECGVILEIKIADSINSDLKTQADVSLFCK